MFCPKCNEKLLLRIPMNDRIVDLKPKRSYEIRWITRLKFHQPILFLKLYFKKLFSSTWLRTIRCVCPFCGFNLYGGIERTNFGIWAGFWEETDDMEEEII